jgi:tetratricopeptide (TPR) repeat protein
MNERLVISFRRIKPTATGVLLVIVLFGAYANHFHNSFHFDDAHTIVNNASIRSLRNLPLFFCDATTFSSLPSNQSYRPLLSGLFAIDYRVGGGLHPFWFHVSIFALFLAIVLLIAFIVSRLTNNLWIGLATAALYGLQPANADTVNYISASSDLISTLGIVASFALYLGPNLRRYYIYALPAAITILAKPVAAIFPVLLAFYRLIFDWHNSRPVGTRLQRIAEIAVPFAICALALLFVQHMTPRTWVGGERDAHNYLITQPYVALLYFKFFFWPASLSADYDLSPFTSTNDSRFWIGVGFLSLLLAMSILCARLRKTRVIAFGMLWFLIALLPTSLFPLAEAMNDHRAFLAYVGLVIGVAGAAVLFLQLRIFRRTSATIALASTILLLLCTCGFATFRRNRVWRDEETLWRDVTIKSPRNPRGLMNYGNTLMAKGDFADALDYFHRARQIAPDYPVLLINLAVAEDMTNQGATAEQHFQEALRLAPNSPDSYTFYARSLIAHSRIAEGRTLLGGALKLSPSDVTARELLAKAGAAHAKEGSESYLAASLEYYRQKRYVDTIAACEAALKLRPDYAEAWNNICAANNELGRYQEAAAACERALYFKPDFDLARNNLQYARDKINLSAR